MREIVWRIGDPDASPSPHPDDAARARERLERGNEDFVAVVGDEPDRRIVELAPEELGVSGTGRAPEQRPFAAVLSCADARVPVELLMSQRANDLFVVRVAGAVLSEDALGSLDFAIAQLPTVRLTVTLGHTRCGAVGAAVDTYLDPSSYLRLGDSRPLLAVIQHLLGAVRIAAHTMEAVHGVEVMHRPGYRDALVDLAVVANAGAVGLAVAARAARRGSASAGGVEACYGVYDLVSRQVGLPGATVEWVPGLTDAPTDPDTVTHDLHEIAFGPRITRLLDVVPAVH